MANLTIFLTFSFLLPQKGAKPAFKAPGGCHSDLNGEGFVQS